MPTPPLQLRPVPNSLPFSLCADGALPLHSILSIGNDAGMMWTRALLSKASGCMVQSALPDQVLRLVLGRRYSLVVFGESLSDGDAWRLVVGVRAVQPRPALLLLARAGVRRLASLEALFDRVVWPGAGPDVLSCAMRELLAIPLC